MPDKSILGFEAHLGEGLRLWLLLLVFSFQRLPSCSPLSEQFTQLRIISLNTSPEQNPQFLFKRALRAIVCVKKSWNNFIPMCIMDF